MIRTQAPETMIDDPRRSGRWRLATVLLVTVASLVLRTGFPVAATGWAAHDDRLFIEQATNLASGQWLGPFDERTLAKGAMYPIFIAALFTLGIPLRIGEQLLYLSASGLAAGLVARTSGSRGAGLAAYALLAFNPYLWGAPLSRVVRENLYLSLSFALVLVLAAALRRWRRLGSVDPGVAALVLLAGLVAGAYFVTREEWPWIVPAVATLILGAALHLRWTFRRNEALRERLLLLPGLALAVVFAIGFGAVVGSVVWRNESEYGVLLVNDLRRGRFPEARRALYRIGTGPRERTVRFPLKSRLLAYAASPAVAELRPSLEGPVGESWRQVGCQETGSPDCSEFNAGWFVWALRDATAGAGHYASAADAQAFFRRISEEVTRACDSGELPCRVPRDSLAPGLSVADLREMWAGSVHMAGWLLHHGDGEIGSRESRGSDREMERFRTLVGPVARRGGEGWVEASGWFARVGEPPRLDLRRTGYGSRTVSLAVGPAPDVEVALGVEGLKAVRFELATDCVEPDCSLLLDADAEDPVGIRPDALARGAIEVDGFRGFIDRTARVPAAQGPEAARARRTHRIRRVAGPIAALYSVLLPWASLAALVGLGAALGVRRGRAERLEVVLWATVAVIAVASRMGMLAVLSVGWLPTAINLLYLSPASPFFLFAVACGIAAGVRTIGAVRAADA